MSTANTTESCNVIARAIHAAPASLLIADNNGTVLYANRAVGDTTGFHTPQIIGQKAGRLWGGVMPRAFYADMWHTIKHERRPWVAPVTNTYRGEQTDDWLHVAPIIDANTREARLFAEIHQPSRDPHREQDFQHQVREQAEHELMSTEEVLPRMVAWITGAQCTQNLERNQVEAIRDIAQRWPCFTHAINEILVKPTNERLHDRYDDGKMIYKAQQTPEAFGALYTKYHAQIRGYFIKHLGTSELVADLTHDTFTNALAHINSYKIHNASYKTYLMRIAHNVLVNHFRKTSSERNNLDHIPETIASLGSVERQIIRDAIRTLSAVHQQVIYLKYSCGYSIKEIADIMNKSENAVKLHLSRARKQLRGCYTS